MNRFGGENAEIDARKRQAAIAGIRKLRRPLPPGFKFDREETHERPSQAENMRITRAVKSRGSKSATAP